MPRVARRAGIFLLAFLLASLIFVLIANAAVSSFKGEVYQTIDDALPEFEAALVLGTSKSLRSGGPNLYFAFRMDAAAELYNSGRVRVLFLSGSRNGVYYNEPADMVAALEQRGVPLEALIIDESGDDTFRSVKNVHEMLGIDRVVVVTQDFHAQRALYLSSNLGYQDAALIADSLSDQTRTRLEIREIFARVKAVVDLAVHGLVHG